jgi:hypothetical protein
MIENSNNPDIATDVKAGARSHHHVLWARKTWDRINPTLMPPNKSATNKMICIVKIRVIGIFPTSANARRQDFQVLRGF